LFYLNYRKYVYPSWLSDLQDFLANYTEEPSLFMSKVADIAKDLNILDLERVRKYIFNKKVINLSQPVLSLEDYLTLLTFALNSGQSKIGPDHKLDIFVSRRLSVNAFKELSSHPQDTPSDVPIDLAMRFMETCKFSQKSSAIKVESLHIREFTWRDYISFFEPAASTFYLKLRKGGKRVEISAFLVPKILNFWPKFGDIFDKLGLLEDDWIVRLMITLMISP
jgi:hypothetical protein